LLWYGWLAQSSPIKAQKHPYTAAEAERADTEADTLRSWDALYKSYKRYRHCDDRAEGYSESVARILVDHWGTLSQLVSISENGGKFFQFVLRHVDATANSTDLEKIRVNASKRCPPGLHSMCADLGRKNPL
jgi:hypothetical protein